MPDVMEPEPWHIGQLDQLVEHPLPKVVSTEGAARLAGEDELDHFGAGPRAGYLVAGLLSLEPQT